MEELIRSDNLNLAEKLAVTAYLHNFPKNSLESAVKQAKSNNYNKTSNVEMGVIGNVWVRRLISYKPGTLAEPHKHNHDHIHILARGSAELIIEGHEPRVLKEGDIVPVPADHLHHLVALEPNTVGFCVFALRDEAGEVTDYWDGLYTAYGKANG